MQASCTLQTIPVDKIQTSPLQPDSRFTERAIKPLRNSIEQRRCLCPPVLDRKLRIVDGHRRLRVLMEGGATSVACLVLEEELPDEVIALVNDPMLRWNSRHKLEAWCQCETAAARKALLATINAATRNRILNLEKCLGTKALHQLVTDCPWVTPSDWDAVRELRGAFATHDLPAIPDAKLADWCCRFGFWGVWRVHRKTATRTRLKRVRARLLEGKAFSAKEWGA